MIYPWQQSQWQHFLQYVRNNKLPQALLLTGEKALGKFDFAKACAAQILCTAAEEACGICQACHWVNEGVHPDLHVIEPENSQIIKIDQIRALTQSVAKSAHQQYKVIIINPAQTMNMAAANALLKTLEEPSGKTIFFLVTDNAYTLPATIISRCSGLTFAQPQWSVAYDWLAQQVSAEEAKIALELANGLPLLADAWLQDQAVDSYLESLQLLLQAAAGTEFPLSVAQKLAKLDYAVLLNLLYKLLNDLIQVNCQIQVSPHCYQDAQLLIQVANRMSLDKLFELLDEVNQLRSIHLRHIALNQQLQLESFLINLNSSLREAHDART